MFAILLLFIAPILARVALYAISDDPRSWRDADWSSTGLLPAAADSTPARVVIFTGAAGAWKGIFSVHSWIVLKRANEPRWQRYDVVGWGEPIRLNNWPVDGKWYGNKPVMIADICGPEAERLIPRIEATVKDYNYSQTGDYRIWPGPNSNSFIARSCAPCRSLVFHCRRTQLAVISGMAFMPDEQIAAPDLKLTCTAWPGLSSAGSRASRLISWVWSLVLICVTRA